METVAWSFGKFTLLADRRLLMAEGLPVRLGGRALDVLIALVDYAGQFVSRDELISRIWGARVVEEINLRVQVATLRRLLGDDGRGDPQFILNAPNKGYCFIAPVTRIAKAPVISRVRPTSTDLPMPLAALVGRDATVWRLVDDLRNCRVISIVGAGGAGKTVVAIKVGAAVAHRYSDGVLHVDLGGLADVHVASQRIAAALGPSSDVPRAAAWIVESLRERQLLLLLDGCEGVIDLVAMLAEEIQGKASGVHLLVTSREPLRIPGEQVHRLGPLDVPPSEELDAPDLALSFSSVQLFLERMCTGSGDFDPTANDILLMSGICRRLDGLPLAIELAAHCTAHLGLSGILEQLEEGFDVLVDERRADVPHHQSLRACFDWSFANLLPREQQVLCRLSVFAGAFSLASGAHLASVEDLAGGDTVSELIGQLATKSLIAVEAGPGGVQYRLIGATRSYARERLLAMGDDGRASLRHAQWVAGLLDPSVEGQVLQESSAESSRLPAGLDEIRTALDWLSRQDGLAALSVRLLAGSVPAWFALGEVAEFRDRASEALRGVPEQGFGLDEIRVMAAVGHAHLHLLGAGGGARAESERAVALAERLGHRETHLVALWGLWLTHCLGGDHAEALHVAECHEAVNASAPGEAVISVVADKHETLIVSPVARTDITDDVMFLVSLMNAGRHPEARVRGERMLAGSLLMPGDGARAGSQLDDEVIGRASLSRLLWIQGLTGRALAMARDAADVACRSLDAPTACFCLHELCVVALWAGELDLASHAVASLSRLATMHGLAYWEAWTRFDRAAIAFLGGGPMRPDWRDPTCGVPQLELMATLSPDLPEPEVLLRADAGQAPWCEPEVLRARGCQAAFLETEQGRLKALALFERALDVARSQGALAWELRAATSIATVSIQPQERSMAIDLLTTTLSRFTEGFTTPDLRRATDLLEKLSSK